MLYYKLLDIQDIDIIIQKCLQYAKSIDSAYNRRLSSWNLVSVEDLEKACPELVVGLKKYDLTIQMAVLFVMYFPAHGAIHLDKYPSQARVNIPLLNCSNTYTNFYETDGGMEEHFNPVTNIIKYVPTSECRLVDRVELKQATVIRTKVFHSVDLPRYNPIPRITLSLGLDKDPVFLLE